MRMTRITPDNAEYFENLAPEGLLEDEDLLCLGAITGDDEACAVLAAGVREDAAYIEWIYTDPEYRSEGAARSLLKSLRVLLRKIEVEAVIVSFSDDCENLEDFLEAEGFFIDEDKGYYSVPLVDLMYSETMERWLEVRERDDGAMTAAELKDPEELYDFIRENGISVRRGKDMLRYSVVRLDDDENITGCILIRKNPEGYLEVPYFLNDGSTEGAKELFMAVRDLVKKHGWDDENIVFSDRAGETIGFLEQVTDETRDNYALTGLKQAIRLL